MISKWKSLILDKQFTLRGNNMKFFIQTADVLLCNFVFFPALVCYWRGLWDLLAVYIYPGQKPLNHWMVTLIGSFSILGYFVFPLVDAYYSQIKHTSSTLYFIGTRFCLFVYGVISLAYWRGVWELFDYYLGKNPIPAMALFVCSFMLLAGCRACRTTIYSPVVIYLDTRKNVLVPATCFRSKVGNQNNIFISRHHA